MKKPHIRSVVGPRWNSLVGWIDFSAILKDTDWRQYECVDAEATGSGATPKEAYDDWYKAVLRPYQNGPHFMAAFKLAQTPR
jgi:hypothetical protein